MAAKKQEIDCSEIIERPLAEWRRIYSTESKAYGIRVNRYKGTQKLVYLPDTIEGEKVVLYGYFPDDCAVICSKRLFGQLGDPVRVATALACLERPEKFPGEYGKTVQSYILRNAKDIGQAIVEKDRADLLPAYLALMGKKIDLDALERLLAAADAARECKAYLMDLKSDRYSADTIEAVRTVQMEKEIGIREKTVADWKKVFTFVNDGDGVCINGCKSSEDTVVIPEKIGNRFVTSVNIGFFLRDRYPDAHGPQRIQKLIVPKGIRIGAFRDAEQARSVMKKIALDGAAAETRFDAPKKLIFPEIERIERVSDDSDPETGPVLSDRITVGSIVRMGHYPGASDGRDKIPWIVICADTEKALLLTEACIEGCDRCADLGSGILNWVRGFRYFGLNDAERARCLSGADAEQTFLLTEEQVAQYAIASRFAAAKPTESLLSAGARTDADGFCPWMIDDAPSGRPMLIKTVLPDGTISAFRFEKDARIGIRPAVWIRLHD